MFKNYFKTAWRNLWRNKSFSLINLSGLAIGMAAAILIFLWIQNEMSYDRWYKKAGRIYQVFNRETTNGKASAWGSTPDPLAPILKADYPDIEDAVRVNEGEALLSVQDKHISSQGVFADAGFLSMFDFATIHGDSKGALSQVNNIVITERLANKLFGTTAATGKFLRVDSTQNFIVTAVLKDLPGNTRFNFEYVLPWSFEQKTYGAIESWTAYNDRTFVLLKPGAEESRVNEKIKSVAFKHSDPEDKNAQLTQFLYPAKRWHLYDKSENGQMVGGAIERVKLFGLIAGLILLIACINFMNLSTARSEKRAKEVGIRKVAGARRQSLIVQFIAESMLLAFLAGIIAIVLVQLSLPAYNNILQTNFHLPVGNISFWLYGLGFVFLTGFVSGCYPAFFLSSFNAAKVLKGSFKSPGKLVTPRKVMVVVQFVFAVTLIISTIIIAQQIQYAESRDTGFDKNQLVFSPLNESNKNSYASIKRDLLNSGAVVSVTRSLVPISAAWTSNMWGYEWPGSTKGESKLSFDAYSSDADFSKTLGTKIVAGRDIDIYTYPTDSAAILLNEKAVETMHLQNPLGATVKRGDDEVYHVVGIVKNFIIGSPYNNIQPMVVMGPKYGWFRAVHYRLSSTQPVKESLAKIEGVFKKYNADYPFEYQFVDDAYAAKFKSEQTTQTLATLFASLTIFISCLGLFGLAAYMAENRVKEIGIRKVLGASVPGITALLSKDFLQLVGISCLIAFPLGWLAMDNWLQSYQYRVQISWWIFIAAGISAMIIALVTVSFQSIKAAIANPVKSLRTE